MIPNLTPTSPRDAMDFVMAECRERVAGADQDILVAAMKIIETELERFCCAEHGPIDKRDYATTMSVLYAIAFGIQERAKGGH